MITHSIKVTIYMPICKHNLHKAVRLIGKDHARLLVMFAVEQDSLEILWKKRIKKYIKSVNEYVADHLFRYGRMPADFGFEDLVMDHYFDVNKKSIKSAEMELKFLEPKDKRLAAKPPPLKVPRTLENLQRVYDAFKNNRGMPKRQQTFADKIKKAYIKKCQRVWEQFTESFREGEVFDKEEARRVISDASRGVASRTNTIIETETTNFYNNARRNIYDKADVVTHYLFLAIRDQATTKWCTDKTTDGKRGRHGLVYKKGDEITEKETPACFVEGTPVLTMRGWLPIDCIGIADYVWTHENRWRKIKKIYCEKKENVPILPIGHALATSGHPYFKRGFGFVKAIHFRPEEGVFASSLSMRKVLGACLDALVQARPKVLLFSLSHAIFGSYSERSWSSVVERWKLKSKRWVLRAQLAVTSTRLEERDSVGAYSDSRERAWPIVDKERSSSSQKSDKIRQQAGESPGDDEVGAHEIAPQIGWVKSSENVYNLEVEEDHTYYAGGYLVHNCHWNCRSEFTPLTPYNPRHKKLIEDDKLQRRNNVCYPLPKGWN